MPHLAAAEGSTPSAPIFENRIGRPRGPGTPFPGLNWVRSANSEHTRLLPDGMPVQLRPDPPTHHAAAVAQQEEQPAFTRTRVGSIPTSGTSNSVPGSSSGRTSRFGRENGGSNPSPGTNDATIRVRLTESRLALNEETDVRLVPPEPEQQQARMGSSPIRVCRGGVAEARSARTRSAPVRIRPSAPDATKTKTETHSPVAQ